MWIVLSINNSRYQIWQVSVLIWSIELSISYVSLKSDTITCVEMSYVLAFFSPLKLEKVFSPAFLPFLFVFLSTSVANATPAICKLVQKKFQGSQFLWIKQGPKFLKGG